MKYKAKKEKPHIIKNVFYCLSMGYKCSPFAFTALLLNSIISNLYYGVVVNVLFLETALDMIEKNVSFSDFALKVCIIAVGKLLVEAIDWWCNFSVKEKFEIKCEAKINEILFKKAAQVELSCFESSDFFDKYTRATWLVERKGFRTMIVRLFNLVSSIISYVFLTVYLIRIDVFMLIFTLSPIVVFMLKSKRAKQDFEKEKEQTRHERCKDYVRRTVLLKDFAKDIKTTNIFSVLKKYFTNSVEENIIIIKKYGLRIILTESLIDFFGTVIPIGGGFVYACYRLISIGSITVAQFSVLITAVLKAKERISIAAFNFAAVQKCSLWVQSIREFLAYEPKIKSGEKIPDEMESIEFKNVSFSYDGSDVNALKNISFILKKGETLAIVGKNGAGKTTLSKLLMRLYDVTDGEILYNGVNIKEYNLSEYRKRFCSVFQDYKLFAMTCAENILINETNEQNIKTAEYAAEMSGIDEKIKPLENGINTLLTKEFDENGTLLSGGEAQKLSISKLFAREYDIAVLDEPSSALDPVAEARIYENINNGIPDKAVIFISHRLSSAAAADKILVFSDGELIEAGSHSQLMAKKGEYAEMFTLQASGYHGEVHCDD